MMNITMNDQYTAASLYGGGWRACDRNDLMAEYDLSRSEADAICEGLHEIENEMEVA